MKDHRKLLRYHRRRRRGESHVGSAVSDIHRLTWRAALLSLLLLSKRTAAAAGHHHVSSFMEQREKESERKILSFDLHPTATLALKGRRRLLWANSSSSSSSSSVELDYDETQDWFHPNSNAIYATIPKKEELKEFDDDEELVDFHRHRHLSRYERQFRLKEGFDLQPDWDGHYCFNGDLAERLSQTTNTTGGKVASSRLLLKDPSSAHVGGIFNNYQGVSLSQGYGKTRGFLYKLKIIR